MSRRIPPVDWERIVLDLRGAGLTLDDIARTVGRDKATVHGWQSRGAEPRHSDGEALLALWAQRVRGCAVSTEGA